MDRRWLDPSLDLESRVDALLVEMTIDEKIAQLSGTWAPDLLAGGRIDPEAIAARIPHGTGEVTRIGGATNLLPAESAALHNVIQRVAVERTRLGIPVIVHEESLAGYCARGATVFPQAIGLASTWDPDLIEEIAGVIREQLLAVGGRHALAPVLDVARDPRWGRLRGSDFSGMRALLDAHATQSHRHRGTSLTPGGPAYRRPDLDALKVACRLRTARTLSASWTSIATSGRSRVRVVSVGLARRRRSLMFLGYEPTMSPCR